MITEDQGRAIADAVTSTLVDDQLCLIFVRRGADRFTLVISRGWLEIAAALERLTNRPNHHDIPRSAIRAVVGDWPPHWNRIAVPEIFLSNDGIPHLGFDLPTPA